ncbi:MAG: hypothetical protein J3R72DRAFT_475483 [Linnemannia gamsii]|nr:MAG: hypothetical protein J3R72DRAFT_475483 [Linnemannia gamsii]
MVLFNIHSLILSASLAAATIATFATAAPTKPNDRRFSKLDACGRLGKKNGVGIKYKDVADCYRAIPFDRSVAATTVSTVHDLFRDYYVFTDSALTPQVPAPFMSEPVDILKQLQTIGRRKYSSDHKFHTDVRHAIETLRDGHASYDVNCYTNYAFQQYLSLYAPVENGVQSVRVFKDYGDRGYEECIVEKIDGKPALAHIRQWAIQRSTCSHDANARLNCALSRQGYDLEKAIFADEPGEFSITTSLPDKAYIDYELRCSKKPSTIRLRDQWAAFPQKEIEFHDIKSYVANVCINDKKAPASPRQGQSRPHLRNLAIPIKKRDLEDNGPLGAATRPTTPPRPLQQFKNAERLVAGNATVFYHLKTQRDTGVMVVHTFDAAVENEVDTILKGLTAFHARNVTKVLVDFQGNGGGYISLSSYLVQMLFPNKHPLDASYEADVRVTKSVQRAAKLGFKSELGGTYDSHDYLNLQAKGTPRYKNSDLFAKPVTIKRNGRKTQYTEKTAMYFAPLPKEILAAVAAFPWTGRHENIKVLTDGRCGSACGMASYFWTDIHGVEAYSIGGTKGEDLSMFSFSGASVITLNNLQETYSGLKMKSPLKDLKYKNEVRFSWLEIYGKNRTIPLEYDAELYRPKYRLDYTRKNSRSREVLWREVVGAAWK